VISRTAFFGGFEYKLEVSYIDAFYKQVNYPNFAFLIYGFIKALGGKNYLSSVCSLYKLHVL